MSLNYHELTMNEPRDSPARRKQFLVVCVLGASVFLNTFVNSGGFHSVVIEEGVVPGGEFVFKSWTKDYATSMHKVRCALDDVNMDPHGNDVEQGDLFYSLFYDDPSRPPNGATRFFTGSLYDKNRDDDKKNLKKSLLNFRANKLLQPRKEEYCDDDDDRDYEVQPLPNNVMAGVVQFPFTNGFVSALILTYKIIPAMIKYGKEHGVDNPVTFTTCSLSQYMCTHYVPLEKSKEYLLGRPTTDEYLKILSDIEDAKNNQDAVDYAAVWRGIKKLSPL